MRSRWRSRSAAALLAVMTLGGLAGYPVYVAPRTDPPPAAADPADVVVALGGMPSVGTYARRLVDEGRARHLVLSDPYGRDENAVTAMCRDAARHPELTCFVPDPSTTRGEAEEIARLAAVRGWRRIVVVAPRFHVARARMIVRRCWPGALAVVTADVDVPAWAWVYQYGYQTAGFAKALVLRGC